MRVKCPNCKQIYHETTDKYNPDILPNGSMVKLLNKYIKLRWNAFAHGMQGNSGTNYAGMHCPGCTAPMCVKNRLIVVPDEEIKHQCEICGKICKNPQSLGAHMRWHHA